jgi:hypothetical protein
MRIENPPSINMNNILPQNYDWGKDIRNIEIYKRMAVDFREQDCRGRDFQRDLAKDLNYQVMYDINKL